MCGFMYWELALPSSGIVISLSVWVTPSAIYTWVLPVPSLQKIQYSFCLTQQIEKLAILDVIESPFRINASLYITQYIFGTTYVIFMCTYLRTIRYQEIYSFRITRESVCLFNLATSTWGIFIYASEPLCIHAVHHTKNQTDSPEKLNSRFL